jgi:hypothetical protein
MNLIPFTGIAFLWFMAVLRSRLGDREDRFFATVFIGSGLLFVAMLFVVAAVSKALLDNFATDGSDPEQSETFAVCRAIVHTLMHTFALKMAAVFIFVTSSISLRTCVFPRWIALVGYVLGLVMLLAISEFAWIALLFPAFVLLLSVYILATEFSRRFRLPSTGREKSRDGRMSECE